MENFLDWQQKHSLPLARSLYSLSSGSKAPKSSKASVLRMCFTSVRVMKILDVMVTVRRLLRDGGKTGPQSTSPISRQLKFLFLIQSSSSSDRKLESLELLARLTFPKISTGLLSRLPSIHSSSSATVICGVDDRLMFGDGSSISTVDVESQRFINSVNLIAGLRHLRLGGVKSFSVKATPVCSSK